jgi:hypothetical protein
MDLRYASIIYFQVRRSRIRLHAHQSTLDDFNLAEYVMAVGKYLDWNKTTGHG